MRQYVLRRLLIAVPSLLGISLVLFTVLALAPGDPFSELATNPNVPPEVGLALRAKFGLDDPIYLRYLHWLVAMAQGDWGFSFVSRVNVDTLILQRLPTTLYVIGSAQLLALLIAIPVGVYAATRPYSTVRSDRQYARLHRFFAADLLHRASCSSCSFRSGWTGCRLSIRPTSMRPASTGSANNYGRRSCPSWCWACFRRLR